MKHSSSLNTFRRTKGGHLDDVVNSSSVVRIAPSTDQQSNMNGGNNGNDDLDGSCHSPMVGDYFQQA
jgi:hypothetical protein